MHRVKTWDWNSWKLNGDTLDWNSWKLNGDILAQAENMRLRFMKIKWWHSCTGWKPGAWDSWKLNGDILAQDENLGPEFHENEIMKCLHRMKTRGLSFMKMKCWSSFAGWKPGVWVSWALLWDTRNVKQRFSLVAFVPQTPFLLKNFSPHLGLKTPEPV